MKHECYAVGQPATLAPKAIMDRNGIVVLQWCIRCHRTEAELVDHPECTVDCPRMGQPCDDERCLKGWCRREEHYP